MGGEYNINMNEEDYLIDTESEIGLHYIYDKSERESLTDAELRAIIVQNGL